MTKMGIIMGSAPSSGSTLLVNLIGRADSVFQTDELYIFDKPDWIAGRDPSLQSQWPSRYNRGYPAHFAHESPLVFPTAHSVPRFEKYEGTYTDFCLSYMDNLAEENGCSRWVEKTPTNIFALPLLASLLPTMKFLVIVRHPGSVLRSLSRRRMNEFTAAARVYFPMLVAANIASRSNVKIIKYEELTAAPLSTAGQVFDFVGEPFSATYLDARASGGLHLPSWKFKPSMGIMQENEPAPRIGSNHGYHLLNLRANKYFLDYTATDAVYSFAELCNIFDYKAPIDIPPKSRPEPWLQRFEAYARYVVKAKVAGRPVRRCWFD